MTKSRNIRAPLSLETKKKLSDGMIEKWKDRRKNPSLRLLKKQVKLRDDYTCKQCGIRDPEIVQVDHIKPQCLFPELTFELYNMVTVCPNCHARKTNREKKITRNAKALRKSI